jgi:hypothetical protein
MGLETVKLFISLSNVKNLNLLVLTCSEKPITINWVPAHLVNLIVVSGYSMNSLSAGSWIPNLDEVVFAPSQNKTFLGVPVTASDI